MKFSSVSIGILLAAFVVFVSPFASAEAITVSFSIETSIEPITGVGLIMKQSGVTQKPGVQFSKAEKGTWKASFTIDSSEVDENAFASVILISSEGDLAASNVRSLTSAATPPIPQCPPQQSIALTADTQIGVLQSLVSIRTARRDNAQARVEEVLKGDFLAMLKKLEAGFGLSRTKELSPDLPPVELIDRLARILNSVKNYRITKPDK